MASTKEGRGHSIWKIILIVLHVVFVIGGITFSYAYTTLHRRPRSGQNSSEDRVNETRFFTDDYDTGLSPASWTLSIWIFIYTWQFIYSLYAASTIFRKNENGEYLYNASPSHIHFSYYIVYIISDGVVMGWLVVAGMNRFTLMFVFLLVASLLICASGFNVCRSLEKAGATLEQSGLVKDIWMTRMFIINGLSFYGTWCTIATLINLVIMLVNVANFDMTIGCWIGISILTVICLVWFVLETFVFDRYLRYVFSPYIVLVVALSGMLSKNWTDPVPNYTYYTAVLLGVAAALGIVKIVVMIVKARRNPISYSDALISDQRSHLEMET